MKTNYIIALIPPAAAFMARYFVRSHWRLFLWAFIVMWGAVWVGSLVANR